MGDAKHLPQNTPTFQHTLEGDVLESTAGVIFAGRGFLPPLLLIAHTPSSTTSQKQRGERSTTHNKQVVSGTLVRL